MDFNFVRILNCTVAVMRGLGNFVRICEVREVLIENQIVALREATIRVSFRNS